MDQESRWLTFKFPYLQKISNKNHTSTLTWASPAAADSHRSELAVSHASH